MTEKIGVMVCGHGSRDEGAVREFASVAKGIAERLPQYEVESGFLEFATPIIRTGWISWWKVDITIFLQFPACSSRLVTPKMIFRPC